MRIGNGNAIKNLSDKKFVPLLDLRMFVFCDFWHMQS